MNNILFNHILVPYNGSKVSQKSLKKAIGLAKMTNSKITIPTCLEKRSVFGMFKFKADKKELSGEEKLVMQEHKKLEKYANQQGLKPVFKITKTNEGVKPYLNMQKITM